MAMRNLGKPNMGGGQVKTGFKLMRQSVLRGTRPERPSAKGPIGTNHPIIEVYARKKRPKMF